MSWWHLLVVLLVLAGFGFYYWINRGGDDDEDEAGANEEGADDDTSSEEDGFDRARFHADRGDPRKFWAQAAIALYQDDTDPGCWVQANALRCLQVGWTTPDREELIQLIQRYIEGECNIGYDKVRIIFLARAGRGAGWLDEETSWQYAFAAIADVQKHYSSWEQLRQAMDEGRDQWFGGREEVPESQLELHERGWQNLTRNYLAQVPFYGAQSA